MAAPQAFIISPRPSMTVFYFVREAEAEDFAGQVELEGRVYNGGFFDGMPCGRETSRDFTNQQGVKLYAVTG
jgi:hypothetical protein